MSIFQDNCIDSAAARTGAFRSKQLKLLAGASSLAFCFAPTAVYAQDGNAAVEEEEVNENEIVVSGIRGSLERAQNIKRNADGIVDAISAEDIGKFPDTNLAESLQRISGVSIDRVNGEGSSVTVRGFGAGFNLVTLNGRTLPGADVALAGTDRSGAGANGRGFDFSNLASEGVSGLQVYKTGRATIASGGIGSTVNISTARPLDSDGLQASFSAKAVYDTTVIQGDDLTPEFSGLASWTDDSGRFGVGLFGSYQKRDSGGASASVASWNILTREEFLDPSSGLITDTTDVQGLSSTAELVAIPRDSRYFVSDLERERINGHAVIQFAPTDNLTFTADATYARTDNEEQRASLSNWFNRPFSEAIFDGDDVLASPLSLSEINNGSKDFAVTNDEVSTRDEFESYGINVEWQATDNFRFVLDAHTSESRVTPRLNSTALGSPQSRIEVGLAAPFVVGQTQTYSSSGIPQQFVTIDSSNPDGVAGFDINDVSTTVANTFSITQNNSIDEINAFGVWEFDDSNSFTFGVNYRSQENLTDTSDQRQLLGFWDAGNPGDVAEFAPGVLDQFCLTCEFNDFDTGIADGAETGQSFRGSANDLFNLVSPAYTALEGTADDPNGSDNTVAQIGRVNSSVQEDIIALYGQFESEFDVGGRPANLNIGFRYEDTDVSSTSVFQVPSVIQYTSDNDFNTIISPDPIPVTVDAGYDNFLPNIDFSVEVVDDVVVRASYSKTIARAGFGNLIATSAVGSIPGPTALGNVATGTSGNPALLPLESDNYDFSAEWYYDSSSYVSLGYFFKRVDNFLGQGTVDQSLFGLQDVTAGAPGTLSGDALDIINDNPDAIVSARNLFAVAALIDTTDAASAAATLAANLDAAGQITEAIFSPLSTNVVLEPGAADPLFNFQVNQPINNNQADIQGLEFAFQHFFGDTGFGVAGSYTYVDGDVGFNVNAAPDQDQFALTGLSDTANLTLIYENYGISARVAYNWRDEFLSSANIGDGFNNPSFVDSFGQFDFNITYDLTENVVLSLEGINITGEDLRVTGRSDSQVQFAQELGPRYLFGARYKF